jgi:hypothetical protein
MAEIVILAIIAITGIRVLRSCLEFALYARKHANEMLSTRILPQGTWGPNNPTQDIPVSRLYTLVNYVFTIIIVYAIIFMFMALIVFVVVNAIEILSQ